MGWKRSGFAAFALFSFVAGGCSGGGGGSGSSSSSGPTSLTVQSTNPANGATGVALNAKVSATFSKVMTADLRNGTTFKLSVGKDDVPGTVSFTDTTAIFTPSGNLAVSTVFTAMIRIDEKNPAGHSPTTSIYIWSFTTGTERPPDLCVIPGGGGVNNCYPKISDALAAADPGSVIGVAEGTYTENVLLTKTVTLEGGWDLAFTNPDPTMNVTTIKPANPAVAVVTVQGTLGKTPAVAPVIDGFTITGAVSTDPGGGLRIQNSDAVVRNNIITGNQAHLDGGGVWVQNGAPTFENNRIENNTLDANGGKGGGIELESTQASLIGNTIDSNRVPGSTGYGGGIAILGGTVFLDGGSISGNSVQLGDGCGLYAESSAVQLNAASIKENTCYGLYMKTTTYTLTNMRVTGNETGGLKATTTSPGVLTNNTFADNLNEGINTDSLLTLVNNIISGHTIGVTLTAGGAVNSRYNDYDNTTDTSGFAKDATDLAVDPDLTADFHLAAGSPVIDAGTHGPVAKAGSTTETVVPPATDLDGESRAMIGTSGLYKVDMGADERTGTAQRIVDLDAAAADLTVNGPGGIFGSLTNAPDRDWIGYSVLGADVNGDGRADLVVAAEDFAIDPNNPPFTPGRLFGVFNTGSRKTGTLDLLDTIPDLIIDNRMTLQHLGSAMTAGDLNGDGRPDLIAGSYEDDNGGGGAVWPTVFAFWTGSTLTGTRLMDDTHPADFELRAPGQDFLHFSAKNALTTADLNADGRTDLIVGDGWADDGGMGDTGAVFVIFGGSGLSGLHDLGSTPADYTLYGPAAAAGLQSLAAGKVNADTQIDLAARTDSTAYVIFGPIGAGTRHLGATLADITITGLSAGGVAVMDLTGDGQDDLILGSADKVYILPGPLAAGSYSIGSVAGLITLTGVADAAAMDEVFAVGNVAGDSKPDLIIGSPTLKRAFAVAGGPGISGTADVADASAILVRSAALTFLGTDVAAGDLDNDGRPDMIVGSKFLDVDSHLGNFKDAGIVYVIYGK